MFNNDSNKSNINDLNCSIKVVLVVYDSVSKDSAPLGAGGERPQGPGLTNVWAGGVYSGRVFNAHM